MKRLLFYFILFFFSLKTSFSQISKEFWFAVPDIASPFDKPVYFRISTLDSASNVTISIPANKRFKPVEVKIIPNSSIRVDFTEFLGLIENITANEVTNKGIYIKATYPVSIYYEVVGSSSLQGSIQNSEIFNLKGDAGLGKKFFIPLQNLLPNYSLSMAYSSFDIVATEDSTLISISPTQNIVGHNALIPYNIVLNKGQTYSAKAIGKLGHDHPIGSLVLSNKRIAITVKDDLVHQYTGWDLVGDQIIPVEHTGNNYIIPKGYVEHHLFKQNDGDRAIMIATEENTIISINGKKKKKLKLAGDFFNYQINKDFVYIEGSKPIYVFHLSGTGSELSGTILPPLTNKGLRQVNFTRTLNNPTFINIIVKSGGQNNFYLNGSNSLIKASNFHEIKKVGWLVARVNLDNKVNFLGNNILVNDSLDFYMALISGKMTGGTSLYGFWSNYLNENSNISLHKELLKKLAKRISFDISKDILTTESLEVLEDVVQLMKENPLYKLIIQGHTDNDGSFEQNMILSRKRAEAVKNFLITNGIENDRLISIGYADQKPISDNETKDGKAKNRRSELHLIEE